MTHDAQITIGLAPGAGFEVRTLADLDTYLGATADAGFDAVSLSQAQLCGEPDRASRLLETHGLRCTDLLSLRVSRDEEATLEQARALRPAVEVLHPQCVLTLFWTRRTADSIDLLGRTAEAVGVPLALEFAIGGAADTLVSADSIVDEVGSARATILADTFHFFRGTSTLDMLEDVPLDHLAIVQLNDALPALSDDYMDETTNRRTWPGLGEFDLDGFCGRLRDRGWQGVVSVEVLGADLRELPIHEYCRQAYRTSAAYWR